MRKRNIIATLKKAGFDVTMKDGTLHLEKRDFGGQGADVYWIIDVYYHNHGYYNVWYHQAMVEKVTFTVQDILFFTDYCLDSLDDFWTLVLTMA